jgi:myosin heavy subunit
VVTRVSNLIEVLNDILLSGDGWFSEKSFVEFAQKYFVLDSKDLWLLDESDFRILVDTYKSLLDEEVLEGESGRIEAFTVALRRKFLEDKSSFVPSKGQTGPAAYKAKKNQSGDGPIKAKSSHADIHGDWGKMVPDKIEAPKYANPIKAKSSHADTAPKYAERPVKASAKSEPPARIVKQRKKIAVALAAHYKKRANELDTKLSGPKRKDDSGTKSDRARAAITRFVQGIKKKLGRRATEDVASERKGKFRFLKTKRPSSRIVAGRPASHVLARRATVAKTVAQNHKKPQKQNKPSEMEQLWARRHGVRRLRHEEIDNMEWSVIATRLRAVIEELNGGVPSEQTESEENTVEAFSDEQLEGVAQVLGVDVEDLLVAEEGDLQQALGEMSYKVMAHPKYGRAGLKGKHPWTPTNRAGKTLSHAAPAHSGMPGHKSAKVPKHSSAPYARSPKRVK